MRISGWNQSYKVVKPWLIPNAGILYPRCPEELTIQASVEDPRESSTHQEINARLPGFPPDECHGIRISMLMRFELGSELILRC